MITATHAPLRHRALALAAGGAFVVLGLAGCGDGGAPDAGIDGGLPDAGAPRDWPAAEVPLDDEPEPGIARAWIAVDGVVAPNNPVTGEASPPGHDRFAVVRYRPVGATELRASVVMVPGIFGGAGSFDPLARHLVRRSIEAGEPIEVLAVDRRANLLEDLRGADAAEAMREPDVARGYYFDGETVGGEAFAGFLPQADVSYMSEWGLATHLGDLRALIDATASSPRERVFLLGHSLGGAMTEAFLAWRFEDGARGADLLAGAILVDGAAADAPITEAEYQGGVTGGIAPLPGLEAIRGGTRYIALPLLGLDVYPQAELAAMEALYAPDEVRVDRGRAEVLGALLTLPPQRVPPMTNAAAFGWAFDEASNGLSFAAVSVGASTGGPTEPYDSLFGATLIRPSDPSATYAWIDAPDADPPELTPLASLAHMWVDGRTNFAEWYFPARLSLDLAAVGGLAAPEGGWQSQAGLRAFDGALVDAPILAIAAALAPPERYDALRARAAPVGPGRPNAGATRTEPAGFEVVDAGEATHIDPLSAADVPANPTPAAILAFVLANAAPGLVDAR